MEPVEHVNISFYKDRKNLEDQSTWMMIDLGPQEESMLYRLSEIFRKAPTERNEAIQELITTAKKKTVAVDHHVLREIGEEVPELRIGERVSLQKSQERDRDIQIPHKKVRSSPALQSNVQSIDDFINQSFNSSIIDSTMDESNNRTMDESNNRTIDESNNQKASTSKEVQVEPKKVEKRESDVELSPQRKRSVEIIEDMYRKVGGYFQDVCPNIAYSELRRLYPKDFERMEFLEKVIDEFIDDPLEVERKSVDYLRTVERIAKQVNEKVKKNGALDSILSTYADVAPTVRDATLLPLQGSDRKLSDQGEGEGDFLSATLPYLELAAKPPTGAAGSLIDEWIETSINESNKPTIEQSNNKEFNIDDFL